ncbi:MAG TPA: ATP-binding protein [Minicystis sp.]|nr:ATP-binding protein [Minicystis sp.]
MGDATTRRLTPPEGGVPPSPTSRPSDPNTARDLAGALHEVSNALTVLMGWIGRARDASGSAAEVERALDVAAGRAAQARAIVRRAIGAEVAEDPPTSVRDVVRDAVLGLDPAARKAGVEVETRIDRDAFEAPLPSATHVVQILTNLLLNALAVSSDGGAVRVEARVERAPSGRARVRLAVEDEGPGVPPERRATLFDAGVTTRRGGAGIGLRYAAAMARAAGGELSLADTEDGARFELVWPCVDEPVRVFVETSPESVTRGRLPLEGRRILILEDDVAVVDLLDTALTARGADVVTIQRHDELSGALSSGPFDAALFDISPIQEDIKGALGEVREQSGGVRLVMISGSAESMPPLPEDWVSAWVRKPFEIGEIVAALTRTRA